MTEKKGIKLAAFSLILQTIVSANIYAQKQFDSAQVIGVMRSAADWQLQNEREYAKTDWHYGAFYTGLWAHFQTTQDQKYLEHLTALGEKESWRLMDDIFHADRLTIAQVFLDMSLELNNPKLSEPTLWALDAHIGRRTKPDISFDGNAYRFEWWTWCDALYMAPPAFARAYTATGDIKYLDYINENWWIVSDYLYDVDEHLYFRDDRFLNKKTQNGKKVFWSRGNGWVMGGLVRVLQHMPLDYGPREKLVTQYKEMAAKIASIQGKDGLWRSSLLDTEEFPVGESSGSAFFCYALTWGINQGLLPEKTYKKVALKAWKALVKNVNDSGMLGYVQQVGDSPKAISADDWEVYGTGAFLLAGSEIIKLNKSIGK